MPFMITAWQADLVAMVGGATTKAAESRPGIAWCRYGQLRLILMRTLVRGLHENARQ